MQILNLKLAVTFTENFLLKCIIHILLHVLFTGYFHNLDPDHGPWTRTLDPGPEKPGPRKIWTLKNLE